MPNPCVPAREAFASPISIFQFVRTNTSRLSVKCIGGPEDCARILHPILLVTRPFMKFANEAHPPAALRTLAFSCHGSCYQL